MSVSALSHANASGFGEARSVSIQKISQEPNVFAAMLQNARQIEQVDAAQAQGASSAGQINNVNTSSAQLFAHELAKVQNGGLNSSYQFNEQYLRNILNPYQANEALGLEAANAVYGVQGTTPVRAENLQSVNVNLEDKILDFTALLPMGTKNFMKDLNCNADELNSFVNNMIFGTDQGPQGLNAAKFFGASSMTAQELSDSLKTILAQANVNTLDVQGEDFNFVLRQEGSELGQTIGVNNGESLAERALERDLEGSFKRDMALMQILARTSNQNANIF